MKRTVLVENAGERALRALFCGQQTVQVDHCSPAMHVVIEGIISRLYVNPEVQMMIQTGLVNHAVILSCVISELEAAGLTLHMSAADVLETIFSRMDIGMTIDVASMGVLERIFAQAELEMELCAGDVSVSTSTAVKLKDEIALYIGVVMNAVVVRLRMLADDPDVFISDFMDIPLHDFFRYEEV